MPNRERAVLGSRRPGDKRAVRFWDALFVNRTRRSGASAEILHVSSCPLRQILSDVTSESKWNRCMLYSLLFTLCVGQTSVCGGLQPASARLLKSAAG